MFLIDTVVLSELRKRERSPSVVKWFTNQRDTDLYLSVISIGEIEQGIFQRQNRNPEFAQELATWLDKVLNLYGDRIVPIDLPTCRRWGRLTATVGHDSVDLMIAASALEHGLTVVTRNVKHFTPTGVPVVDPFTTETD